MEKKLKVKKKTIIGQFLDTVTARKLDGFTWDRYEQIVEHKTSNYSYFAPLKMALLAADQRTFEAETKTIAYKIGFLFQSQVFSPSMTGGVSRTTS